MAQNPACDLRIQAWERLRSHFQAHKFERNSVPARECEAAVHVISRYLDCQESEVQTIGAVRTVFVKLAALQEHDTRLADNFNLHDIQRSFEDICRLAASGDAKKSSISCCDTLGSGGPFSDFAALLELEQVIDHLRPIMGKARRASKLVSWPARASITVKAAGAKTTVHDPVHDLSECVDNLSESAKACRTAAASCDPQHICLALEDLRAKAADLSSTYDETLCLLEQLRCTTQPATFAMVEDEIFRFGFFAAEAIRAVNRLQAPCTGLAGPLQTVWADMLAYLNGPVKRAFAKFESKELCPPKLCYDNATADVRAAIERGQADAAGLTLDSYGCDAAALYQHRIYVDNVVHEVIQLDCKTREGFDECVWRRLGSFPIRMYAILDRANIMAIDQATNIATGWNDFTAWLKNPGPSTFKPDVLPFVRAGLGILHWLQDRAKGYGVCAELPSCGPGQTSLFLKIIDENNQGIPNTQVQVSTGAGDTWRATTDPGGNLLLSVPKGVAVSVAPAVGALAEFPVQTMTIN